MLMSDTDIAKAIAAGDINIWADDLESATLAAGGHPQLQPASIDVRLHRELILFSDLVDEIDPQVRQPELTYGHTMLEGRSFRLGPGEFILGSTEEFVELGPNVAAMVNGKSSLGRLGLEVHSTAGWIDPGWSGRITLEIKNVNNKPILLRPLMPIAQFIFFGTGSPATRPYGCPELGSRYSHQTTVTASRSWM